MEKECESFDSTTSWLDGTRRLTTRSKGEHWRVPKMTGSGSDRSAQMTLEPIYASSTIVETLTHWYSSLLKVRTSHLIYSFLFRIRAAIKTHLVPFGTTHQKTITTTDWLVARLNNLCFLCLHAKLATINLENFFATEVILPTAALQSLATTRSFRFRKL